MSLLHWYEVGHSHSKMPQHNFKYSSLVVPLLVLPLSYQLNWKLLYFDCSDFWFFPSTDFFYADGLFFQAYVVFWFLFFLACFSHLIPMKPLMFFLISTFFT